MTGPTLTGPVRIGVLPRIDPMSVAAEWQALAARADASFFRSWTWIGCLAAERFANATLLRVERGGVPVGLALLNRTRISRLGGQWFGERLWLGESGDAALDAVYVEHNGALLARDCADLLPACLRTLLGAGRMLRLSGVDDAHLAAARMAGMVRVLRSQPAPYADLSALPPDADGGYLASLSANTRYQIRRSDRAYAACGALVLRRAATLAEALAFLDALAVLHQATWTARGRPGAFANPAFLRFHRALLARAIPRNEAELLCLTAGARAVGYLYNFRHRGRVLAYQSGFDYAAPGPHAKPGLSCHHAAIDLARREGMTSYDFLAGDDRYKTSMANAATTLHWLDVAPRRSPAGVLLRLHQGISRSPRANSAT